MGEKLVVSTAEVAKMLGMSEQGVRIGIQRGTLPIGYAIKTNQGDRLKYIIPKAKLNEFLGVKDENA